jgi:DNA-binding NarL/FixJ family response regulator
LSISIDFVEFVLMTGNPEALLLPDGAITPLIVNRDDATRIGLAVLLQRQRWVGRCVLADDLSQALPLAQRHRPEVALLDISNAGPFAASMTSALHRSHPSVQIVLTSRCATSPSAPPHQLGAVSFLPPAAPSQEMVAAIRSAALSIDAPPRAQDGVAPAGLTDREHELLALISTGATNREIAVLLHLGPDSVKKCAAGLYRKLGVRNRTEAARRAAELGPELSRGSAAEAAAAPGAAGQVSR